METRSGDSDIIILRSYYFARAGVRKKGALRLVLLQEDRGSKATRARTVLLARVCTT